VRSGLNEQHPIRFLGLATAGVLTGSAGLVTVGVLRIAYEDPSRIVVAAVATMLYLPVHLWHTYHAAHGRRPRGTAWSLAAMAVVIVAVLPVVGVQWLGALYPLAASVLLVLRPPWSVVTFCVLLAVPVPATFAFGEPSWAPYFTAGVALTGLVLAVPVWLIAATRELGSARERLAAEAVVRERVRVEADLHETLGVALESIADTGDRAADLITRAPDRATGPLGEIVTAARTTLSAARRLNARWHQSPARAELDTAVALLRAAGIDAELRGSPRGVPDTQLAALHDQVARLLQDGAVRRCVVDVGPGGVRVVTA